MHVFKIQSATSTRNIRICGAVIAAGFWFSLNTQPVVTGVIGPQELNANSAASVKSDYGKLPLSFEANKGRPMTR